jgi:2-oxoglutarate dehydrogenase E2 component (dihydrolipoamide succinyltransferase)
MSIVELKVPTIGESITEVTLSQWLKEDGAYVQLDEALCEFESDKATLEFPSEAAGKLIHVAKEGDDLEIGAVVAKIDTSVSAPSDVDSGSSKSAAPTVEKKATATPAATKETSTYASGHPSPAANKILKEKDIDPASVTGTGRDGRITKEDALNAEKSVQPATQSAETAKPAFVSPALATSQFSREVQREKMSRMRRTIAKRLVSAKNNTAMLTTFNEVDLTEVMSLRKKVQDKFFEKHQIKLGFMSLFAKACALTLMEMPAVNAMIDGDDLIYHDYADISIAISTPSGLVVPPVHNVESLQFHEIEWKIKELAEKARSGKLSLEEMSGGTFTITNGGVFGSMMSTPIINEPQSAILGMHAIQERPMAINGEVKIRPMMYLALSYDHRVIDGSSSVTFLVKVKEKLENPTLLLMGL